MEYGKEGEEENRRNRDRKRKRVLKKRQKRRRKRTTTSSRRLLIKIDRGRRREGGAKVEAVDVLCGEIDPLTDQGSCYCAIIILLLLLFLFFSIFSNPPLETGRKK